MNNTGTKQVRIMKQTAFKKKEYTPCLNIRYLYLLNKYIKCNFGGYRCGTSIIVDIRRRKVKEVGWDSVEWINLAQDRAKWLPVGKI